MDGVLLYTCCLLSHPHSTVRFLMNDLPLYFALTFLTILSPGAGVLFTVTSALRSGFQDAWQAPLGNVLASACVAVACAAGIGAILTASPLVSASCRDSLLWYSFIWPGAAGMHRLTALLRSQTLRLPSITRQHPLPNGRTAPRFLRQLFCCS